MSENIDYLDWSKIELVKEIKKLNERRKYGLVWNEEKTKEVFEKESQGKLPVLTEDIKKSISDNKNKLAPYNVLIEGDNYHALSVLNYTHNKKIDIIYIDPPYNLGGEIGAFRYNDKYVTDDDGYKHSKWLSFMRNRLILAKKMLKKDGLLMISINDAEDSQLKLLCDDIFTESNFITKLIWKTRENVDGRSLTGISIDHEYVIIYRNSDVGKFRGKMINRDKFSNPDSDPRGPWMSSPIDGIATKNRRPNLHYTIINKKTGKMYDPNPANGWRFSKTTLAKLIEEHRIIWPKNPKSKPRIKRYLNELSSMFTGFSSLLDTVTYSTGTRELRNMMGRESFKFPKPVELIMKLLEQHKNKNSIILDFFAGSGTTGHAVLELNKKDQGNRKFILCTNNENKICTDVCYPRLKKVIRGYGNNKDERVKGLDGNLKYFKTAFVNSEPTDQNKKIIVSQSTEMLCLKEDCFELIKEGKQFKIFKNSDGSYMGIVYYYDGIIPFKKEVLKLKVKINTYVFSLVDKVDPEDFIDVYQWVTLKPIPSTILNVYRRIYVNVRFKKLSRKTYN